MSILKTLKLTAATRKVTLTPEQVLRDKLVSYLNEQKALAEAEIGGTAFSATKRVTRTNEAGEKVRVDAPRHVRKGWFTDAAGQMFFQIRYGSNTATRLLTVLISPFSVMSHAAMLGVTICRLPAIA